MTKRSVVLVKRSASIQTWHMPIMVEDFRSAGKVNSRPWSRILNKPFGYSLPIQKPMQSVVRFILKQGNIKLPSRITKLMYE